MWIFFGTKRLIPISSPKAKHIQKTLDLSLKPTWDVPILLSFFGAQVFSFNVVVQLGNSTISGQGIPSHVDTHSIFSETLMSLSLGSPVVMEMKLEGVNETAPIKTPVLLPPRSLAIFEDDSRYGWKHGIASKRFDTFEDSKSGSTENFERSKRVSYTYRKLRIPPFCSCSKFFNYGSQLFENSRNRFLTK